MSVICFNHKVSASCCHSMMICFSQELALRDYEAKLDVDPDAKPKFFKPRAVPYLLRPTIGQELDKLVSMGILEQVMTSEWVSCIPSLQFLKHTDSYAFVVVITRSL